MREARNVCQSTKRVKLSLGGPIHPKSIVLRNRENKKQLIRILLPVCLRILVHFGTKLNLDLRGVMRFEQ